MPSTYHTTHEQVEFVAGRTFTLNGVRYESGDPVPKAEVLGANHVEALVRSRCTLPVVDREEDIPRNLTYWREIKTRDFVLTKLGKEDKRETTKPAKKAAAKKAEK